MKKKLMALLLAVITIAALLPAVSATEYCYVRSRRVESPGYCYCYDKTSDSKGKNLGRFDDGTQLEYLGIPSTNNEWAKVTGTNTKGKRITGYVHLDCITMDAPGEEQIQYLEIYSRKTGKSGYCYCYDKASDTKGKNVGSFNDGDQVEYVSTTDDGNWYLVAGYNTKGKFICGYIRADAANFIEVDYEDTPATATPKAKATATPKATKKASATATPNATKKATAAPTATPEPETVYVTVYSRRVDCPGYCYCYDKESDVSGTNLGRFDDGDVLEYIKTSANGKWIMVAGYNTRGRFICGYVHADCVSFDGDIPAATATPKSKSKSTPTPTPRKKNYDVDSDIIVEVDTSRGYCYCYEEDDDDSEILGRFNNGDEIEYLHSNSDGGWFYVRGRNTKGKTIKGYVRADTVVFEPAPFEPEDDTTYMVIDCSAKSCPGYCYVYSEPSDTFGERLGRFDNGDIVEYVMTTVNGKYYLVRGVVTNGEYVQGYIPTFAAKQYKSR